MFRQLVGAMLSLCHPTAVKLPRAPANEKPPCEFDGQQQLENVMVGTSLTWRVMLWVRRTCQTRRWPKRTTKQLPQVATGRTGKGIQVQRSQPSCAMRVLTQRTRSPAIRQRLEGPLPQPLILPLPTETETETETQGQTQNT